MKKLLAFSCLMCATTLSAAGPMGKGSLPPVFPKDVADKAQAARVRADVGVVFQYPEHQLFADTVYHDVAFGPRNLKLSDEEVDARVRESLALVNLARASLFEPEACFLERPLSDLDAEGRAIALSWIAEHMEQGCRFITTVEPLREALLMPGVACWHEEGRFIMVDQDDDGDDDRESAYEGDEVRVLKIPARTETATLLFDPRDIDFAESMNKATYLSVRGERYQTPRTMDELERELSRAGFFRCHRSFLVNVQKVAKVERYTRNSFNLTLNDAAHSSIPLAKGRAEEMRERYRW